MFKVNIKGSQQIKQTDNDLIEDKRAHKFSNYNAFKHKASAVLGAIWKINGLRIILFWS